MKTRYLCLLLLLFLPFANELSAQKRVINGMINVETGDDLEIFEYNKYIVIYTFMQSSDAEEALEILKKNPEARIGHASLTKKPDRYGNFEIDLEPEGVMLVWCSDRRFEYQLFNNIAVKSGMKINLRQTNSKEKDKGKEIPGVTVTETKIKRKAAVARAEEGENGDLKASISISIPYPHRVKKNLRVVAQPIWYDRTDMIDEESDTLFSYCKAVYRDQKEYSMTQARLMDYDMMHDTLYSYNSHVKNKRYNNIISHTKKITRNGIEHIETIYDTLISNISFSKDSIHIFIIDTVSGADPDASHPYPFGAVVAVGDYNTVLYRDSSKYNNGERRSPLKFLDFKFKEFMPNKDDFKEIQENERIDIPGELYLNFLSGKSTIVPNDSASKAQLENLRKTFSMIAEDESQELVGVYVYGMASPEGSLVSNKNLARNRAQYAINEIRKFTNRAVQMKEPEVAGWERVGELLAADGYASEAEEVNKIINSYPGQIEKQSGEIYKLSYYRSLIYNVYLPKLRTVRYEYIVNKLGTLEPEEILKRYKENKNTVFDRGSFWRLFDEEFITDKQELEAVTKHALKVTRNIYDEDSVYCKGYWPYAACLLACCYIARDTTDLELLTPFLDLKTVYNKETDTEEVQNLRHRRISNIRSGQLVEYINFPEFAANQLTMILNSGNASQYRNTIPVLESIINDAVVKGIAGVEYDTVIAMSKCKRGGYKVDKISKTEEEAAKIRNITASTSPTNLVVINLAIDDPYDTSDDSKYLAIAKDGMKNLPDNAKSDYLKAVIMLRLNDKVKAEEFLAESFKKDYKMMAYANNDLDLMPNPESNEGGNYKVTYGAMRLWNRAMDSLTVNDEKHPYTWYRKSLDVLTKGNNPNVEFARESMYRCFDMDKRYFTILGIAIRNDDDIRQKKELIEILKEFRKNYSQTE